MGGTGRRGERLKAEAELTPNAGLTERQRFRVVKSGNRELWQTSGRGTVARGTRGEWGVALLTTTGRISSSASRAQL
jgi:hypothetical protein